MGLKITILWEIAKMPSSTQAFFLNAPTFCFERPDVFKKRRGIFLKHRHLFFKDGYLFKKDGVLLGELLRCLKIKSWNFTLHTLHSSRKMVNGEGGEG